MNLHLILHKVRGEPAFDIAEQLAVNGDLWWIIPTSGHRAYPQAFWPLSEFVLRHPYYNQGMRADKYLETIVLPPGTPDHFSCNDRQDGGGDKPRSVPAARKSTVTPLTIDDLE